MQVVGYAYNADVHCPKCTFDYARAVPYSEYVFGEYTDEDIESHNPGVIDLEKAIELEVIRDGEGNAIHPIFDNQETDMPEHCSDCHEYIDTSWTGECVNYVTESLWDYVVGTKINGHKGDYQVLDQWRDELKWCTTDSGDDLIVLLYNTTREWEYQ